MESSGSIQTARSALIVAVTILLFAIAMLVAAYDFPGGSGVFPRFAGWIFVGLSSVEVFLRGKQWLADKKIEAGGWVNPMVIKELIGFAWIGFFLLLIYLAGFLIGIPLYLLVFLRFSAGRSWKECLLLSGGATLSIYLLFIELLEYRLYSGIFMAS